LAGSPVGAEFGGVCAVDRSTAGSRRFKLAQPGIKIDIKILLTLLGGFQLEIQGFDLAAQAGQFVRLALDLARQIQLGLSLLVETCLRFDLLVSDLATRFFVVKHTGLSLRGTQGSNQKGKAEAPHDQNSPRPSAALYRMSARRFSDQADSS
jgi:hypothetical protein